MLSIGASDSYAVADFICLENGHIIDDHLNSPDRVFGMVWCVCLSVCLHSDNNLFNWMTFDLGI